MRSPSSVNSLGAYAASHSPAESVRASRLLTAMMRAATSGLSLVTWTRSGARSALAARCNCCESSATLRRSRRWVVYRTSSRAAVSANRRAKSPAMDICFSSQAFCSGFPLGAAGASDSTCRASGLLTLKHIPARPSPRRYFTISRRRAAWQRPRKPLSSPAFSRVTISRIEEVRVQTVYAREQMIEQQVRAWDVLDERVLDVMRRVPRELFVPQGQRYRAYADVEVPLARGQRML